MIELIPSIQSTRSALDAERTRIEIVSQNLANANVTRSVDGQPYKRKQVVLHTGEPC
jgi:flagellar basal-body rod protein FlgC